MSRLGAATLVALAALTRVLLAADPGAAQEWWSLRELDGAPVRAVLPPDAIRAVDDPAMLSGAAADRQMATDEPILGVRLGSLARAYPLGYLSSREIVNDRLGESPIAVTW